MKMKKLSVWLGAGLLGLACGPASAASVSSLFFPGQLNQLSDNSAESQNLNADGNTSTIGPAPVGSPILNLGDTLRGTLDIQTLEDLTGGGGTNSVGSGGNNELSGIFEIEVVGFTVVVDPDGSCGVDPTCGGGTLLNGDELANYVFGPHTSFWQLGPDGLAASGDELTAGTMVAFFEDDSPDYDRTNASIPTIEGTALPDVFGTAPLLELGVTGDYTAQGAGIVVSAITGLVDGDELWSAIAAPVVPAAGSVVPQGTGLGVFNLQLSMLSENLTVDFDQVAAGVNLVDGLVDINGSGGISGTQGSGSGYDIFDNVDLVVHVQGVPEPGILALMSLGLFGLGGMVRRFRG